jgi:hypothetical protein
MIFGASNKLDYTFRRCQCDRACRNGDIRSPLTCSGIAVQLDSNPEHRQLDTDLPHGLPQDTFSWEQLRAVLSELELCLCYHNDIPNICNVGLATSAGL